jgi:hypothetical protein
MYFRLKKMKQLTTARVSLRAPLNNELQLNGTVIGRNYELS